MKDYSNILRELVEECQEDFVGLWEVVGRLDRGYPGELDDDEIRNMTLQIVGEILATNEDIRAGNFTKDGFKPWSLPKDEAVLRIKQEWERLGVRSPRPFEIVALVGGHDL